MNLECYSVPKNNIRMFCCNFLYNTYLYVIKGDGNVGSHCKTSQNSNTNQTSPYSQKDLIVLP
jgi:hypothetical protein